MTVIHIVLFKFLPTTTTLQKSTFIKEVKSLKSLSCVKESRLLVGGPSISNPIEISKGYEFALVSFHEDRGKLEEYQASEEHERVVSTYLRPFKEDVVRFDFEVEKEDEALVGILAGLGKLAH